MKGYGHPGQVTTPGFGLKGVVDTTSASAKVKPLVIILHQFCKPNTVFLKNSASVPLIPLSSLVPLGSHRFSWPPSHLLFASSVFGVLNHHPYFSADFCHSPLLCLSFLLAFPLASSEFPLPSLFVRCTKVDFQQSEASHTGRSFF